MIYMERKISANIAEEKGLGFRYQASLNSDGNLTLRAVACQGTKDEESSLVIFNLRETEAIFELMRAIKRISHDNDLPF